MLVKNPVNSYRSRCNRFFPDIRRRPVCTDEITRAAVHRTAALSLHLFVVVWLLLYIGQFEPYFFFRSSALSHSPRSIAAMPQLAKITIGSV